jgi:tRNA(Ile)-lysidine synthase
MSVDRSSGLLKRVFGKLDAILAANSRCESNSSQNHPSIAVAFSGGLDSAVLLDLAIKYCSEKSISLFAFHVHHGISPNADTWLDHCKSVCVNSAINFDFAHVNLLDGGHHSIEARARTARYRALGELCIKHRVDVLLTAHHQDDQAETVLLQLLRGSGVAGLSGMDAFNYAANLLGDENLLLARPLLDLTRVELEQFGFEHKISYVNDESNDDHRYARNALRHRVMPILAQISPGYAERIARSASHLQSAHRVLSELSSQDLARAKLDDGSLLIDQIKNLGNERLVNLLRHWIGELGAQMPTTARLDELHSQLFSAKSDAMVTVAHDGWNIHRYGNRIYADRIVAVDVDVQTEQVFRWSGESSIPFPQFGGELHFDYTSFGFDQSWLMTQSLVMHLRRGRERIKLAPNRSTRDMKSHYQTLKIPFWLRQRLPFVSSDSHLLFAAGVGSDCHFCSDGESRIQLRWVETQSSLLA